MRGSHLVYILHEPYVSYEAVKRMPVPTAYVLCEQLRGVSIETESTTEAYLIVILNIKAYLKFAEFECRENQPKKRTKNRVFVSTFARLFLESCDAVLSPAKARAADLKVFY